MTTFDPAAWVAAYEALGGHLAAVRQPNGEEGLCITFPRDRRGEGAQLQLELHRARGRGDAVADYVFATREVR